MTNVLDLKGRVALVTGAGQGVGRQAALHLASNGAGGVVVNDFHLERALAVAEEVRAMGGSATAVQADVTSLESVEQMFAKAQEAFGPVDVLINNAGNAGPTRDVADIKPFWETGPHDWATWLGTNFYGVLNCCKAALPNMMSRRYGRKGGSGRLHESACQGRRTVGHYRELRCIVGNPYAWSSRPHQR
jgi:2-hydroxycyclohexanecarboxyl-CoA dehydrogenase